jgi:hypothetical protein
MLPGTLWTKIHTASEEPYLLPAQHLFLPDINYHRMSPKGPFRLVTVNTAPERAWRLVGRVAEECKDQYTIQHVANCESTWDTNVPISEMPGLNRSLQA